MRQSSAREAVRPRCLPGLRGFKAEQSTLEGHKTPSPSIAVSRGVVRTAEVEVVNGGLYA